MEPSHKAHTVFYRKDKSSDTKSCVKSLLEVDTKYESRKEEYIFETDKTHKGISWPISHVKRRINKAVKLEWN